MNTFVLRCAFALLCACLVVGGLISIVGIFLGVIIGLSWAFDINPAIATFMVLFVVVFVAAFVVGWTAQR